MRVGFIGGGNMGGGIARGLIERGIVRPDEIVICEVVDSVREQLRARHGFRVTVAHADALTEMDAVVLAVKPQDFSAAAKAMRGDLPQEPLLISIMAGVRIETIVAALPTTRAVRVMPNLGATIGESFSTWIGAAGVTESDRRLVRTLLGAVGREYEVQTESYLDMATALAGSGPGFVLLLVEALIDGGVHIGLPRPLATEMALQTMLGAVRWAQVDGRHPAELRAQVVSPAGTTAAGVLALERGGVRAAIVDAVVAAFERSRALGG